MEMVAILGDDEESETRRVEESETGMLISESRRDLHSSDLALITSAYEH